MTVVFSSPHPLGGDGPSRPYTHIRDALRTRYGSELIEVTPLAFDAILVDRAQLGHGIGPAFDDLASHALSHHPGLKDRGNALMGEHGNILLAGGGAALNTQRDGIFSRTATLWFSTWWKHAYKVLSDEYALNGIHGHPIHPYVCWRAEHEQQESDVLIVPSVACAATYPADLKDKIHVAEFGVDSNEFMPRVGVAVGGPLRVLMPATNPYRKGARYALHAMERLPEDAAELTLTGVQLGSQHARNIRLAGWVSNEDMKYAYETSDAYLSASLEEGQALASLEAAACGLPLILTPETGLPIRDGKEGLLIPARDPKAITGAIQYLIDNPGERKRMGREARIFAQARPWSKFGDRVNQIIEEASQ